MISTFCLPKFAQKLNYFLINSAIVIKLNDTQDPILSELGLSRRNLVNSYIKTVKIFHGCASIVDFEHVLADRVMIN